MGTDRILRRLEVMERLGVSEPTFRRLRRAPDFPPRIQLTERIGGWRESDIVEFVRLRESVQTAGQRG